MEHTVTLNLYEQIPAEDWMLSLIQAAANKALELGAQGVRAALLDVTLTDDPGIREVNMAHREIDAPTDVLSFPMLDASEPGVLLLDEGGTHPEHGAILGDILVSLPRMRAQAEEYGHGQARELGFLVTHGMLHLLGYNHETPEQEAQMTELQERVLNALDLPR